MGWDKREWVLSGWLAHAWTHFSSFFFLLFLCPAGSTPFEPRSQVWMGSEFLGPNKKKKTLTSISSLFSGDKKMNVWSRALLAWCGFLFDRDNFVLFALIPHHGSPPFHFLLIIAAYARLISLHGKTAVVWAEGGGGSTAMMVYLCSLAQERGKNSPRPIFHEGKTRQQQRRTVRWKVRVRFESNFFFSLARRAPYMGKWWRKESLKMFPGFTGGNSKVGRKILFCRFTESGKRWIMLSTFTAPIKHMWYSCHFFSVSVSTGWF